MGSEEAVRSRPPREVGYSYIALPFIFFSDQKMKCEFSTLSSPPSPPPSPICPFHTESQPAMTFRLLSSLSFIMSRFVTFLPLQGMAVEAQGTRTQSACTTEKSKGLR
jgi:hypothetical protein